jgi:hypothetical protein
MKVTSLDDDPGGVRLDLTAAEVRLLRRALERASFIDTPMAEQPEILAFCARALEALK